MSIGQITDVVNYQLQGRDGCVDVVRQRGFGGDRMNRMNIIHDGLVILSRDRFALVRNTKCEMFYDIINSAKSKYLWVFLFESSLGSSEREDRLSFKPTFSSPLFPSSLSISIKIDSTFCRESSTEIILQSSK